MMNPQPTPQSTLRILRIMWVALLMGPVMYMFVAVTNPLGLDEPVEALPGFEEAGTETDGSDEFARTFLTANYVLLAVLLPLGYFVRMQVYKRHWRGDVVSPSGYFTGNLLLLAMCEGVALMSGVGVQLGGSFLPYAGPGVLAIMVQALNFPTGAPMKRHGTDLAKYSRYHRGDD